MVGRYKEEVRKLIGRWSEDIRKIGGENESE